MVPSFGVFDKTEDLVYNGVERYSEFCSEPREEAARTY